VGRASVAAIALVLLTGPAFGIYLQETFDSTSSDVTTDPNYSQYNYSLCPTGAKPTLTVGANHQLQAVLTDRSLPLASEIQAGGLSLLPEKSVRISADMTGSGGTYGNWSIGFELHDQITSEAITLQFTPGFFGSAQLQAHGTYVSYVSPYIGFIPSTTALNHHSLISDGAGHFSATLINGANPAQSFTATFSDSYMTSFKASLMLPTGPITPGGVTAYYDNWQMID